MNQIQSNAPKDYICPICLGVEKVDSEKTLMRKTDIVFSNDYITVFINSFFIKGNEGHIIIVPNKHFENIYTTEPIYLEEIIKISQNMALALKLAYKCDGVTVLQNNEPASGQHAFHYHMHLFPRYNGDDLHANLGDKFLADESVRSEYAEKLIPFIK